MAFLQVPQRFRDREAFLQAYGFHVLACLLRKKSDATSAQCLTTKAVDTSLAVLEACGSERAGQLFWAGVQGLLLDWDLWSRAPPETQVHLLQRVGDVVSRNTRAFRQCMGAQGLLDLLRLHVCVSPDPLRTPGGRKSLERPEQAQLVELCEPLLVAVIEQGYYEKRAAMGTVSFDIGPVGSDKGGGDMLLRCLHETTSPTTSRSRSSACSCRSAPHTATCSGETWSGRATAATSATSC